MMMMKTKEDDMTIRLEKFSASEFRAIPRYENGRIKDLYDAFPYLTTLQVNMLHEDDWAHYQEIQEELDYEIRELNYERQFDADNN
jgi:hypothetical protein